MRMTGIDRDRARDDRRPCVSDQIQGDLDFEGLKISESASRISDHGAATPAGGWERVGGVGFGVRLVGSTRCHCPNKAISIQVIQGVRRQSTVGWCAMRRANVARSSGELALSFVDKLAKLLGA